MNIVKIVFWPYHCVEEEKTSTLVKITSKSDIEHGHTRLHALTRWLSTRPDAPHSSSSPGWADLTRIPVDPTHVTDPDNCDVSMHNWHAMSVPSQLTRQHSGTHLPHHQQRAELSRAEWSRAKLEPSRERGIGSSVANPTCNWIWDWIWAAHQARIVLIKS